MKRGLSIVGIMLAVISFLAIISFDVRGAMQMAADYRASIVRDTVAALRKSP